MGRTGGGDGCRRGRGTVEELMTELENVLTADATGDTNMAQPTHVRCVACGVIHENDGGYPLDWDLCDCYGSLVPATSEEAEDAQLARKG